MVLLLFSCRGHDTWPVPRDTIAKELRPSTDKRREYTPLSSAGLMYYLHGREVLAVVTGPGHEDSLETIFTKVYVDFVEAIDADANGYSIFANGHSDG